MDSDFETIRVESADGIARITLDRPEAHNAFTATMQAECQTAWRSLRTDDDVRVVILTGAGDRAFCTGIDRNEPFTALDGPAVYGTSNNFMYDDPGDSLGPKSNDLWKPVIGAVNGMACGGAFYFLAECDILIAAEHATFFDPHVTYGMAAVYEPMKMLTRMPFGEVMRMSLTGSAERISAATAQRMGRPRTSAAWRPGTLPRRSTRRRSTRPRWPPAPRPSTAASASNPASAEERPPQPTSPMTGGSSGSWATSLRSQSVDMSSSP